MLDLAEGDARIDHDPNARLDAPRVAVVPSKPKARPCVRITADDHTPVQMPASREDGGLVTSAGGRVTIEADRWRVEDAELPPPGRPWGAPGFGPLLDGVAHGICVQPQLRVDGVARDGPPRQASSARAGDQHSGHQHHGAAPDHLQPATPHPPRPSAVHSVARPPDDGEHPKGDEPKESAHVHVQPHEDGEQKKVRQHRQRDGAEHHRPANPRQGTAQNHGSHVWFPCKVAANARRAPDPAPSGAQAPGGASGCHPGHSCACHPDARSV